MHDDDDLIDEQAEGRERLAMVLLEATQGFLEDHPALTRSDVAYAMRAAAGMQWRHMGGG